MDINYSVILMNNIVRLSNPRKNLANAESSFTFFPATDIPRPLVTKQNTRTRVKVILKIAISDLICETRMTLDR